MSGEMRVRQIHVRWNEEEKRGEGEVLMSGCTENELVEIAKRVTGAFICGGGVRCSVGVSKYFNDGMVTNPMETRFYPTPQYIYTTFTIGGEETKRRMEEEEMRRRMEEDRIRREEEERRRREEEERRREEEERRRREEEEARRIREYNKEVHQYNTVVCLLSRIFCYHYSLIPFVILFLYSLLSIIIPLIFLISCSQSVALLICVCGST